MNDALPPNDEMAPARPAPLEAVLPEGEDRYRSLIEWSPEAFNIHRDGKLLYVNQAAVKLFGARSAQELVGKSILDLVHPDFHQITLARAKSILDQGSATTMRELKYFKLDGTAIDVEVQGMPIIFEGKPAALVAMRDITGRKLTEITLLEMNAQLNEKSQLLQTTLDSISQGIFMTDADGRVSTFNHRVAELLELPESLLASRSSIEELTRYQLERGDFGPAEGLVDSHARAYVAAAGKGEIPQRYLRVTPAGRTLEVKTQTLPSGGMVRTFTDVTDYVQAEADRQRLNLLINATHAIARVGGWDADIANDRLFWTEGVYRILETSPEQYSPELATTSQFFTPESRVVVKASYADVVNQPKTHDFVIEMITAKGRHIWVHSMGATTWEQGRPVKRTAMLQDITERKQAEAAWRENEQRWKLALESIGDGVWDWHVQTGERFSSKRLKEMYGFAEHEELDRDEIDTRTHPDDQAQVLRDRQAHFDGLTPTYVNEHRVRCRDGSWKWVLTRGLVISRDAQGKPLRMIGTHTDITERKHSEAALRENEQRWKLALESTGDGMWEWYIQTDEEFFSKSLLKMYGYGDDDAIDPVDKFDLRTHPDDRAQLQLDRQAHFDGLTPTFSNERRLRCKDGSWKWVLSRGMVINRDAQGKPLRMIGTHTDITERKKSESLIWQQAHIDALTGLPNRRMLHERLEQEIKKARRDGQQLALLFIDLDHFKEVNDTLGHDSGDLLLIEAARRLRNCVRESDSVARMGGDEFTVILTELTDASSAEGILQKLLRTLETVFRLNHETIFISASIGVTIYPHDATEIEDLFKNADQALYVAKGAGRNRFSFFTPALQEAAQNRLRLGNDLRTALTDRQFRMVYQPIVELATGTIRKAEALIRWQHPTRGLVSPGEFIEIAETSGLIVDIGEWVFQQAALQAQSWRARLDPQFQISVNKSPVQFHHNCSIDQQWLRQLDALGLPGQSMVVEITEGLLLNSSASVAQQLLELHRAGIAVSLDDFGTGYSSLSYLQKFDIDFIKIDQSFVRHLVPTSTDLALCKAIIVMAHELGMKVIAEGVESVQQRDLLTAAGCDYGQGYLFARPMSASDFETFLAAKPFN
ncbi:MAG: EAL domain-containing protein [Rhodoferax sp.]|uniref:sensor domain-containing protein n=1 Tax=Rhodoferax sp. TaxID=50421 RepID=UPI00260C7772|nr:EAL domain-containing protein [Rhodoferax sp.]MDD5332398.1 EAL domain-containing protein [Rhodoferax sp.]